MFSDLKRVSPMFPRTNKKSLFLPVLLPFLLLPILPAPLLSQENSSVSGENPEKAVELILEGSASLHGTELREALVNAAEIMLLSGNLREAGQLFEQASLAEKGRKDFYSLYRAAMIDIETGDFRKAEARIRAVSTFSDDGMLRLKAGVLQSRIYALTGMQDKALEILETLVSSSPEPPPELVLWAEDFIDSNSSSLDTDRLASLLSENSPGEYSVWSENDRILTPETAFGLYSSDSTDTVVIKDTEPETDDIISDEESETVAIQLGSFSRLENAEDLLKSLSAAGYRAGEIRKKTVNGKLYSVVVITSVPREGIQDKLIELKEKGFEGYPLY